MQDTRTPEGCSQGRTGKSAVAEHVATGRGYVINYQDLQILARSEHYFQRIVRQSVEIMKHPNNFNGEDGYRLSSVWKLVLRHGSATDTVGRPASPTDTIGRPQSQRKVTATGYISTRTTEETSMTSSEEAGSMTSETSSFTTTTTDPNLKVDVIT